MAYPVTIGVPAREDPADLLVHRRTFSADADDWFLRLTDAIDGIGELPESNAVAAEQPDGWVPVVWELIFGRRWDKVRVFFRFDGTTVRIIRVRHAGRRPLSDSEFRRMAHE